MENDLRFILPIHSDVRICEIALKEFSRFAVAATDKMLAEDSSDRYVVRVKGSP